MSSIQTNFSAIAALQTLRGISASKSDMQQQVSSGFRVATASDNAAYWSIATTMRSDNRALSAVSDALGLGAAKAETAYVGLRAVVDVLDQFKSKLVLASEPGVDKSKVQMELEQLKSQVVSIANSSTFNGVNWLITDITDLADIQQTSQSIVSSFVRSAETGTVKTLNFDVSETSLFNTSGGGILQADPDVPLTSLGGLASNTPSGSGYLAFRYYYPGSVTFSPSDTVSFDLTLDDIGSSSGQTYSVVIDYALINSSLGVSDGQTRGPGDFQTILYNYFQSAGIPANVSSGGFVGSDAGSVNIFSEGAPGATANNVQISNVVSTLPGGVAMGLENASTGSFGIPYGSGTMNFSEPFKMGDSDSILFDLEVNNGAAISYTITKADVIAALGSADVTSADKMADVSSYVLSGSGLNFGSSGNSVNISVNPSVHPETGSHSKFKFSNVSGTVTSSNFNFLDIDITTSSNVDGFIRGLDRMIQKAINGASVLGSLNSRIKMQSDFSASLADTITRGVGRLVDADMNEASTRFKALQTQEQLAIQALSIANDNSASIMQLFR